MFAHVPLWAVYPAWGWTTADGERALSYLRRLGSVTVLNGHIHQIMQKVEGSVMFHTAMSTAFRQPAPCTAPSPGPLKVPVDQVRGLLGITGRDVRRAQEPSGDRGLEDRVGAAFLGPFGSSRTVGGSERAAALGWSLAVGLPWYPPGGYRSRW